MPILVVDDEAEIRQLISAVLTEEGYSVDQAPNGYAALIYLRIASTLPCVIVLDLMMPLMSGWEFLRARQNYPLLATIPTVAISAVGTFATARLLGAQEGLDKPIDLDRLVAVVGRYCSGSNTT
jgi:CheY-like chemotaxis protein